MNIARGFVDAVLILGAVVIVTGVVTLAALAVLIAAGVQPCPA